MIKIFKMRSFRSLGVLFLLFSLFIGVGGATQFDFMYEKIFAKEFSSAPNTAKKENPSENSSEQKSFLPVSTKAVSFQEGYEVAYQFLGRVEARRQTRLGFEQGGLIQKIYVEEGDKVQEGEILAELDTQLLKVNVQEILAEKKRLEHLLTEMEQGPRKEQIARARAEVSQFEALLKQARLTEGRAKKLVNQAVVASQELDDSFYQAEALKSQLQVAQERLNELLAGTREEQLLAQKATLAQNEAQLQRLIIQLEKAFLKAPFSGVITSRFVDEGTVLNAGVQVLELLETAHLEVQFGLLGKHLQDLKTEESYELLIEKHRYQAKLKNVIPQREKKTRTIRTIFTIENPSHQIQSGDLASLVLFHPVKAKVTMLPLTALTEGIRGLWACYVAVPIKTKDENNATHEVEKRHVEVLHTSGDHVFVRGMIFEEELIITEGIHRFSHGQRVYLK